MATWAIGDLQGCWKTFSALLSAIRFDPARDRIWLVGDLVNRGAGSLEVLRWCLEHEAVVTAVLGNHDLHLLAAAAGRRSATKRGDTLEPVLRAPDRDALLDWLRARPLLVRTESHLMVHAGLPPWWTVDEAEKRARGLEKKIARGRGKILRPLRGSRPLRWDPDSPDADRIALAAFVGMRWLDEDARLIRDYTGIAGLRTRYCG